MVKIDKNKYSIFFNLLSESGRIKHVFCVRDFEALDCAIETAYYEKEKDIKTDLYRIIDNSSYKFAYFIDNFVFYFAQVPSSDTLKKLKKELGL